MDKLSQYSASAVLTGLLVLAHSFQPVTAAGCQVLSKSTLESKADNFHQPIRSASRKYGVHEDLVKAIITVESCFRSHARGTSGEKGLMQLMPGTARRFNVRSGYNPWQNIHGGTRYLGYLLRRYRGDTHRAVAAYNAGEGNVRPGGRIYNREYVSKVMRAYGKFAGNARGYSYSAPETPRKTRLKLTNSKAPSVKAANTTRTSLSSANRKSKRTSTTVRITSVSTRQVHRHVRSTPRYYQVKRGQTVYAVMRHSGVPVRELIKLNRLRAPYHVQTGQCLKLR